jgi:hypothetical protein
MKSCKPMTPSGRPYEVGMVIHTGVSTMVRRSEGGLVLLVRDTRRLPRELATAWCELEKHEQLTLLGPDCKVTEGGIWDPAWDKPQ